MLVNCRLQFERKETKPGALQWVRTVAGQLDLQTGEFLEVEPDEGLQAINCNVDGFRFECGVFVGEIVEENVTFRVIVYGFQKC